MIKVTMDLISANGPHRDENLVTITIINDGTGTQRRGNYDYTIRGKRGRVLKIGHLHNWPRQSYSACALLQCVINHAYPSGATSSDLRPNQTITADSHGAGLQPGCAAIGNEEDETLDTHPLA